MPETIAHLQHTHGVEDIMLAWETSLETLDMRRKFDEDGEEYEDGFQFDDDDDDEDEDLDDDELDEDDDEDDEEDADFSFGDDEDEE